MAYKSTNIRFIITIKYSFSLLKRKIFTKNFYIIDFYIKASINKVKLMEEEVLYWEPLLNSINEQKCLPFIGYESHSCLPFATLNEKSLHQIDLNKISNNWADEHRYPLENTSQLSNVAQFLAIKFKKDIVPKNDLSRILSKIKPPDFSLEEYNNTPYSVLSKLQLPIYITTNYDHFMEAALISRGRQPVSDFCRWTDYLLKDEVYADLSKNFSKDIFSIGETKLSSVLEQGSEYKPTVERPLVYHLYGDIAAPPSMVLTEKDYFDFVINLHTSTEMNRIPSIILQRLASSSLMFIGYNLEDINFRVIFQGFISLQTTNIRPTSISVHVPQGFNKKKAKLIMEYLSSYTQNFYDLNILWGNINEFILNFNTRWRNYKRMQ